MKRPHAPRRLILALLSLLVLGLAPASAVDAGSGRSANGGPLGQFKHIVVIYEENHSFDNLYGNWGSVGGVAVDGRSNASAARTIQVAQDGSPYNCLLMTDVNLMTAPSGPLSPDCSTTTFSFGTGKPTTAYHFGNAPYNIDTFIPATATTCPPESNLFGFTYGILNGSGQPGGCTRDLVHRFYQEQYQLNGGQMNRYVTGSDSAGMTMGYYDTTKLPIYRYLHAAGAPRYEVLDHFFQAAFGGSFLNHQFLIAARAPIDASATTAQHSVLDANGFPNKSYPLYTPTTSSVVDGPVTQACGLSTTVAGLACGDYAVNTMQPAVPPAGGGAVLPLIHATNPAGTNYEPNICDELSAKGVSWAWYAGGWDNAAGLTNGRGWTNGSGTACADPNVAKNSTWPNCPDASFQFHHQPFNYFAAYAPGQPGRAHLQDEKDFLYAAQNGKLPSVSFVKPLGLDNEHPGYASEPNGSDHLVDLIKAVENGPEAGNTLIVVTYDEFGGQWDHVPPPGMGTAAPAGQADQFGPGTRIPALVIARSLRRSTVDHTVYDTTSILRTIEAQYGLSSLTARDAAVNALSVATRGGHGGSRGGLDSDGDRDTD